MYKIIEFMNSPCYGQSQSRHLLRLVIRREKWLTNPLTMVCTTMRFKAVQSRPQQHPRGLMRLMPKGVRSKKERGSCSVYTLQLCLASKFTWIAIGCLEKSLHFQRH